MIRGQSCKNGFCIWMAVCENAYECLYVRMNSCIFVCMCTCVCISVCIKCVHYKAVKAGVCHAGRGSCRVNTAI